jgi:outer membrane protein
VLFLEEQVRAANERFSLGENTRTDVAQARARLASARAGVSLAEANLTTSRTNYRRLIGHDPDDLIDSFPYGGLIPNGANEAEVVAQDSHPVIRATIHQADAQGFVVKQIQGELLPTVSIQGILEHNESFDTNTDPNTATIIGRLRVPLFQGGIVSARVRQAKEIYGLRRVEIDVARDRVRAAVFSAWGQIAAAKGAIAAAEEGVRAAEIALSGVQEEQRVGQRTTLDVLDAEQDFLDVQLTLVIARRDATVASFALLSAMGLLTAEDLRLPAAVYDPTEHYRAVRDKWFGLRTPDGR